MLSSFIISFREALECAIIVAALFALVTQLNLKHLFKYIFGGAFTGFLVSGIAGAAIIYKMQNLDESARTLFEGGMMLFVAAIIAYFVIWLGSNKNLLNVQDSVKQVNTSAFSLFVISFFTVFKEGLEVVIFLLTDLEHTMLNIIVGSGSGLALAILITVIIYKTALKFSINLIFNIITAMLIVIGANMFGEGIATFFPNAADTTELTATLIYLIPGMYLFIRNLIKGYLKKQI